jgi:hypothetical protein
MREAGVSRAAVWLWLERFIQAGMNGLLRDKIRSPRIHLSTS